MLELDSLISGVYGDIWEVSASSASDVWAGGEDDVRLQGSRTTRSRPLLAHWDGRAWTATPTPLHWGEVDTLVASRGGAWATVSNRERGTVLLHWSGNQWRIMPRPADVPIPRLSTGPRGRVWLIGKRVYERDASSWRPLRALGSVAGHSLQTSRASPEIWRIRLPRRVERWDGKRWSSTPLPRDFHQDVAAVLPFSATEAWIAGSDGDHALVFRWDGSRWRRVPGAPPGAISAKIYATGAHTLWLTGSDSAFRPYLMRREGRSWKRVPPPTREEADDATLYAVGSETWATSQLTEDVFRYICK